MKNKTAEKIWIDLVMTISFILLLFPLWTGMLFHEIAGIALAGLFALHIALNFQWVKAVSRRLDRARGRIRLQLALDALLTLGFTAITVTGLLLSEELVPNLIPGIDRAVAAWIHTYASYGCVGVLVIHIGLHARYIVTAVKKVFAEPRVRRARQAVLGATALALAVAVIYFQLAGQPVLSDEELSSAADTTTPVTTLRPASTTSTDEKKQATVTATPATTITLDDYLSKLFCDGCHRHCSLLTPACGTGERQAQVAQAEYESLYGDTATAQY